MLESGSNSYNDNGNTFLEKNSQLFFRSILISFVLRWICFVFLLFIVVGCVPHRIRTISYHAFHSDPTGYNIHFSLSLKPRNSFAWTMNHKKWIENTPKSDWFDTHIYQYNDIRPYIKLNIYSSFIVVPSKKNCFCLLRMHSLSMNIPFRSVNRLIFERQFQVAYFQCMHSYNPNAFLCIPAIGTAYIGACAFVLRRSEKIIWNGEKTAIGWFSAFIVLSRRQSSSKSS